MTEPFMRELTGVLATSSVKEGEKLEAASPADMMFWMIHTVIERLLAAKRLDTVNSMGGTEFNKWSGVMGKSKSTWEMSSYYNIKKGQNPYYTDAYICTGHAYDDNVLPDMLKFTSAISSVADADNNGNISNWEFYLALDPNSAYLNDYVFDNFEWTHCEGAIEGNDASAKGTSYYGGILRQDSFTFTQVTLLMSVMIGMLMLFTWIQFSATRFANGGDKLETMPTAATYNTHEYYTKGHSGETLPFSSQFSYTAIGK
jgi:hypothetical protein